MPSYISTNRPPQHAHRLLDLTPHTTHEDTTALFNRLWSLQVALRATNRGRLSGQAYIQANTPEDALAALHFALLSLYGSLLELLAITELKFGLAGKVREWVMAKAIANPKAAPGVIWKLHRIVAELESAAQTCHRSIKAGVAVDDRILHALENTPHIFPDLGEDDRPPRNDEDDEGWDLTDFSWASPLAFVEAHTAVQEKRAAGTCGWLLSRDHFGSWETSDVSSTFWLTGSCK